MPTYEYQCACGLLFEGRAAVKDRRKPKPCPDCGEPSPAIPPSTVSGQFKKEVSGPVPQNTGIHDLDTHIDRVIGQSADQGWDVAFGRKRMKEELITNGTDPHLIRRNPDGSYGEMKPEEKAVQTRALKIHEKAGQWRRGELKSGR